MELDPKTDPGVCANIILWCVLGLIFIGIIT